MEEDEVVEESNKTNNRTFNRETGIRVPFIPIV